MIEKYDDLNKEAIKYFNNEKNELFNKKGLLFLLEYLDIFKKDNPQVKFIFKDDKILSIKFINCYPIDFISTVHVMEQDFKFVKGYYKGKDKTYKDCYLIIPLCSIPYDMYFKYDEDEVPDLDILSTTKDFRKYLNDYLAVKMTFDSFDIL